MTRTATRLAAAEITALIRRVSLGFEFDAQESQPFANPGADRGRMLSDATGEHQRVQSAQRRREGADPFLDLVAKQRHRFSRPHVLRFTVEQVTHVGTGLRHAEQPGLEIDHLVELLGAHVLGARQIPNQPGIEIAGPGAHGHPGGRGETHAGVHGFAVTHRRQAGAIAEVGEDDPAWGRFRSGQAGQFSHEKGIRQPVKPVAPHPLRFVAARDRQQPGHARQVMVKSRVETRHLGQVGKSAMKRLGQQDLLRQMLRIEWTEPVQLLNHCRRDALRLAILRPAMHHAMPHRGQCLTPGARLEPIHQHAHRHRVIRRRH